jgi:kynureninase
MTTTAPAAIRALDENDPLREFRGRFCLPENVVYLDGNSLGALPLATMERLATAVSAEWGLGLIRSWTTHGWLDAPQRTGDKIAKLIGAAHGEVIVCDSTSVNLSKLMHAALAARPGRSVLLSESGNFPTDLYIAEGTIRALGGQHSLKLSPAEQIVASIDRDTAVVVLTHVHYKSAAMHDMRALTEAAHAHGALILWDLSHSAGAVEVDLNAAGADLAVGCGYKYLNGGPGAPSFLFVPRRHQDSLLSPLSGWMGHARAFEFVDRYEPAAGIKRFLCGTPAILGATALEVAVDLMLEAGMSRITEKSRALSKLFISLVEQRCDGYGLQLIGPRDVGSRGSHVALAHPRGLAIMRALIERGVIGDFRAPDVLRFGFTPLYTRHEDIWIAVETLREILQTSCWQEKRYSSSDTVT